MAILTEPPELPDQFIPIVGNYLRRLWVWLRRNRITVDHTLTLSEAPGGVMLLGLSNETSDAISDATKLGFGWYPSPYEGGGDTPNDQGLRFRLYSGVINADIVPDNMGSEFTLENNKTQYLRCTTTQSAAGLVTGATLDTTESMAADPAGEMDVAPATSSRALWRFVTADNQITEAVALRVGGIDVTAVVDDMDCGSITLRMFWGSALAALAA